MTQAVDAVVIGAGVVGLAVARALALQGREVVVLEALDAIGSVTSARNSEVIHAGVYYPKGSLKGLLCVRGKELLYDYLATRQIEHRRCGKWIVATDDSEVAMLQRVVEQAAANGCRELDWLTPEQVREQEPALRCVAALSSPTTGIVDSHGFMLSLRGEIEAHGGWVALNSPVQSLEPTSGGLLLQVGGVDPMVLMARTVVNAAGHDAQQIARSVPGLEPSCIPRGYLCKGSYFSLSGAAPFSRLIYPVPGAASLGCHYTVDLGGQGRFGPDAEWVDDIDYGVNPERAVGFYEQIRRYWPGLPDGSLQPAYAGVRPKLQAPGEPAHDFRIDGSDVHGITGLVNLFGIESPGLTSSLAIAEVVSAKV